MSKSDQAVTFFETRNCAQSVFAACAPDSIDKTMCFILAGPFGGGMARTGQTCGAVTGGLMAIATLHGQGMANDPANARGPLYARSAAFMDAFRERHGALSCSDLTGCDLRTPEGQQQFKSRDLHHTLCSKLVASAVELVEKA